MNARKRKKKRSKTPTSIIILTVFIILVGYNYQNSAREFLKEKFIPSSVFNTENQPQTSEKGLEIPIMKSSAGGQIIKRTGYTLSYNADYKTPQWVAWELTKQETAGKESRTNKFIADPDVRGAKAYTSDYTNSGYDRGHMAPAADMKLNKKTMEESFYLSNICPQNPNLNRGDWNDLEEKSRHWAKRFGKVFITCGPIYDSKKPKRIGNNKVGVPSAFYKVILINDKKNPQAIGFIFPNRAGHQSLAKYIVTVDSVEERTGIDFFPSLPDEIEDKIEAELATNLPSIHS